MNLVRRSSTAAAYPPISDEAIFQQQVQYTVDRCGKIRDVLQFPDFLKDLKYCLTLYDYTNILKQLAEADISQLLSSGGSQESSLSLSYKDEKFLNCVLLGTLVGELAQEFENFQVDQSSGFSSILTNWPGYQSSPSLHAIKKLEKDGKNKLLELRKSLERQAGLIKLRSNSPNAKQLYVAQFERIYETSVKYHFDKQMNYTWVLEKAFTNIAEDKAYEISDLSHSSDDPFGYNGFHDISYMVSSIVPEIYTQKMHLPGDLSDSGTTSKKDSSLKVNESPVFLEG